MIKGFAGTVGNYIAPEALAMLGRTAMRFAVPATAAIMQVPDVKSEGLKDFEQIKKP